MTDQITIRMATEADRAALMALWRYAFSDSDAFVEWYFSSYYRAAETIVAEVGGEVHASLQVIAETLVVGKLTVPAGYIVGVDCSPSMRGRGLTRRLMTEAFESYAPAHGLTLLMLMPFEAGFYYDYGFVFGTYHARAVLPMAAFSALGVRGVAYRQLRAEACTEADELTVARLYEAYHQMRDAFYIQRSKRHWQAFFSDLIIEDGHLAFCYDEAGNVQGYLVYTMPEQTMHVRELVALSRQAEQALYYYVASHRSQLQQVHWSAPLDAMVVSRRDVDKEGIRLYPFMMYHVTTPLAIEAFARQRPDHDLIFDYRNVGGTITRYAVQARDGRVQPALQAEKNVDVVLDAAMLTQLVFAPDELRYEQRFTDDIGFTALAQLFDVRFNYVNEYF